MMGWECPRCHSTYAPTVAMCWLCSGFYRPSAGTIAPDPKPPQWYPPIVIGGDLSGGSVTVTANPSLPIWNVIYGGHQ